MHRDRFAQSDPGRVREVLEGAGWRDVAFSAHDEPLWFGPDADRATTFIVGQMAWLFAELDLDGQRWAETNLHDVMAAHEGADGVQLGSGTWLVRPPDAQGESPRHSPPMLLEVTSGQGSTVAQVEVAEPARNIGGRDRVSHQADVHPLRAGG